MDRAECLLRLGDLVRDPRRGIETDADLADIVGVDHLGEDAAQVRRLGTTVDLHRTPLTHRDAYRLLQGAEVGRDRLPHDHAVRRALQRRQGHLSTGIGRCLAGQPADAREPGHRLSALDAGGEIGSCRRSHAHLARGSEQVSQALGLAADGEEVGGHGPVRPRTDTAGRVEDASGSCALRGGLGGRVIEGRGRRAEDDIRCCHGSSRGRWWLGSASLARRDGHDGWVGAVQ